ncbi:hypothetical protein [Streptomyces sp. TRM68367]|nr:hypothetical protein [Streptomyces sp. TRM68367]MBC9731266.1 hypothetical protein [Streptomyces sp. TRM68367]
MDAETVIWTLILFGGTVLAVVWLTYAAWCKEKDGTEKDGAEEGTA